MPITEILTKNADFYPNDVSLVEINPKLEDNRNMTWREFSLMQATAAETYRHEITWGEFEKRSNRFANLLLSRGIKKGEKVGATRVVPLIINEDKIIKAESLIKDKIIKIEEIKRKKCVLITTGNEVYNGRIKDAFLPVIKEKLAHYGSEVIKQIILPDNKEKITEEILKAIKEEEADMIICTGGMSVDPDDVTPTAIKECGGKIVTYGSPVLPGAMFLLAYYNNIPILGVPSCAIYSKRTVLDLVLPRILADERLTVEDIADYGHGGMCLDCNICTFPHCSFGK